VHKISSLITANITPSGFHSGFKLELTMSDGKTGKDLLRVEQGSSAATGPTQLAPAPSTPLEPKGPYSTAPAKRGPIRTILTVVGDVFKGLIPGVKDLVEKYGLGVFAGFLLGLVIGIIILREWEWSRNILLPPSSKTVELGKREKLSGINFSRAESPPPFLSDYEKLFGYFAESQRPTATLENPPVGVVNYVFSKPVQAFAFRLRPRIHNSEINVRVFRELTYGDSNSSRTIYEPVRPQSGSPREGFTFRVQECNANERLFMVLLVVPRQPGITNFTDYFDVSVIE
jgi:hypothetical protein